MMKVLDAYTEKKHFLLAKKNNSYFLISNNQGNLLKGNSKEDIFDNFKLTYSSTSDVSNNLFAVSLNPRVLNISVGDVAKRLFKETFPSPQPIMKLNRNMDIYGVRCDGYSRASTYLSGDVLVKGE